MATIESWTPYGVALDITATAGTITRTSATRYTVVLNVSWKVHWSGASTNYGMWIYANDVNDTQKAITAFGSAHSSGSTTITGTYSISGTGAQTKGVTATFENYNSDTGASSKKSITLNVSVPAWPTYKVSYNANGGSGAPSSQTKVKGTTLKLSSTKPTRTGYSFQGWGTSASDTSVDYAAGASYTKDAAITFYAIWKANTYTVKYNANGGTGAPASQTKTYGVTLKLSTTKPTRTNYNFLGWASSSSAVSAQYAAGANYTANSAVTLYAVWELAYWKPKLTNVSVARCDADGTLNDFGTSASVSFNWQICQLTGNNTTASAIISWDGGSETISLTGESGSVSHVVGSDAISIEASYGFNVAVTDSMNGTTSISRTLSSSSFAVDFIAGGKGVAFGKSAELENTAEFAHSIIGRKPIISECAAPIGDLESYQFQARNGESGTNTYFSAIRTDTGAHVLLGVGSSGYNHGVYSETEDKWMLYFSQNGKLNTGRPVVKHLISVANSSDLTLTNSVASIKMADTRFTLGDSSLFTITSDGGVKLNRSGYIRISAVVHANNLTSGDTLQAQFSAGSTTLSASYSNSGSATFASVSLTPRIVALDADKVVYLRARNYTASRGRVGAGLSTYMIVEYVG